MNKLAFVDLETNKIYNAKKGTFEYYHEEGHIIFQKKFSKVVLYNQLAETIWHLSVTLVLCFTILTIALNSYIFLYFDSFAAVVALMCFIYNLLVLKAEEKWCNNYAKNKMRKK